MRILKKIIVASLMLIAVPVWSREASILGGIVCDTAQNKSSYTYQIEYLDALKAPFAYSISYLNEGHFLHSHRDGVIFQLWGKLPLPDHSLELKGGAGPYWYFDTDESSGSRYEHRHMLGAVFSLGAVWYFSHPFNLQIRSNWTLSDGDADRFSLLAGLGMQLEGKTDQEVPPESPGRIVPENEITPFAGFMVSNNKDPCHAVVSGLEYRRAFGRYLNWTLSYMDEGNNDIFHRRGVATQLWLGDVFYRERLTAGIGFGPYLAWNDYRDRLTGEENHILAGLLSVSISCRLNPIWAIRVTWNRVMTDYDRDSDVYWVGPTFRF